MIGIVSLKYSTASAISLIIFYYVKEFDFAKRE